MSISLPDQDAAPPPVGDDEPEDAAIEAPIRLRDVVPRRYQLPDDMPDVLARLGGQARFKAHDTESGKAVFIKVAEDGSIIPREAAVLTRLDHPAIVRLKHWGRGGGAAFLILDLVDAPDLEAVLRRHSGRLAIDEIKALLAVLCSGVAAIHAAGCLHRDLKPANILVPDFAAPVIADFGAAVPMERADGDIETWLTDGYAAPEQYRAEGGEGPWTDIYGLAAVAYRVLVGNPPAPAPARAGGAWMSPAVSVVGSDAMELAVAVDRALSLDPAKRPRSADDWAAMLKITRILPSLGAIIARADVPAFGPDAAGTVNDVSGANGRSGDGGVDAQTDATALADDPVPPTIRIRRSPDDSFDDRPVAAPDAAASQPVRRSWRWWPIALAVLALAVLSALWAGRPLYERYFKREWIVAQDGSGDVETIGEAIRRAGENATIRIGAGTYPETVVLNESLHLVAAEGAEPVIAPTEGPCLIARGDGGTITGLTFRGATEPADQPLKLPCIVISSGSVWLQDARISAAKGPAIVVRDGARPLIQRTAVTDTPGTSVLVRSGAEPTILNSTFADSGSLVFSEGAKGTLQGNTISTSRSSGLQIRTGADPRIVGNAIEGAAEAGVFVYDSGRGRLEDNRILGSGLSGVVVADGGAPILMGNTISANGEHGVLVLDGSGGAIDRNVITQNNGSGLVLAADSDVELGTNQLEGNTPPQLVDARAR